MVSEQDKKEHLVGSFWTPDAILSLHIRIVHSHTGHGTTGKGDVTFDNFVQACVSIKSLTDSFRRFDTDGDGWIQIKYEDVSWPFPFSILYSVILMSFYAVLGARDSSTFLNNTTTTTLLVNI